MPVPLVAETGSVGVLAAPVFRGDVARLHLALDHVEVRPLHVDLVHRHDQRDLGVADVLEGLVGLRHEAVVGGDHEDRDVGHCRPAGAHLVECGVARGVEERDLAAVKFDLIGADMLGDATRFTGGDVRLADRVEEGGLAVVDVPEDADDRRAHHEVEGLVLVGLLLFLLLLDLLLLHGGVAAVLDVQDEAVLLGHLLGHRFLDGRIHRGEADELVQLGDELEGLEAQRRREIADDDRRLEMEGLDVALDGDERGAAAGQRPGAGIGCWGRGGGAAEDARGRDGRRAGGRRGPGAERSHRSRLGGRRSLGRADRAELRRRRRPHAEGRAHRARARRPLGDKCGSRRGPERAARAGRRRGPVPAWRLPSPRAMTSLARAMSSAVLTNAPTGTRTLLSAGGAGGAATSTGDGAGATGGGAAGDGAIRAPNSFSTSST